MTAALPHRTIPQLEEEIARLKAERELKTAPGPVATRAGTKKRAAAKKKTPAKKRATAKKPPAD